LYVVGTAAALAPIPQNGAGELVVAESRAGGAWKNVVLPIDLRSITNKGGEISNISSSIVKRGATTVVVASVTVMPQVMPALLKKGISVDRGFNYVGDKVEVFAPPTPAMLECERQVNGSSPSFATIPVPGAATAVPATSTTTVSAGESPAIGIASTIVPGADSPRSVSKECEALFNAPPNVAATYTLAELGIDPAVIAQVGTRAHAFVSTSGSPFAEVVLPEPRVPVSVDGGGGTSLLSYGDGFLMTQGQAAGNEITTELLLSSDGRTWQAGESLSGYVTTTGVTDGRPTMVVQRQADGAAPEIVSVNADGSVEHRGSWPHPVSGFDGGNEMVFVGPAGAIGVAGTRTDQSVPQSVDFNGVRFTMTSTDTGQFISATDPAAGTVLLDRVPLQDVQTLLIPAHGNMEAFKAPLDVILARMSWGTQASYVKSLQILDSPDGKTWTSTKLSDLIDLNLDQVISVGNIIVDKDRFIVNLSVAPQTGSVPTTVTLVGRRK
jgi:hypothetical protein